MDKLENEHLKIESTPCAAALHSVYLKGARRTVSLVLSSEEDHLASPTYSGNVIFPFAGRIKGGVFNNLLLDKNDGNNSLHGGRDARRAVFERRAVSESEIEYALHRKSRDDGFPANRDYFVRYSIANNTISIDLKMEADAPVLTDMTVHAYFNLSGEKNIEHHMLKVDADKVVINDKEHCAKEIRDAKNNVFDLSGFRRLKNVIYAEELRFSRGLNNAFVLNPGGNVQLRGGGVTLAASSDSAAAVIYSGGYLEEPSSHIAIEFEDIPLAGKRTVTKSFNRHIEFAFFLLTGQNLELRGCSNSY